MSEQQSLSLQPGDRNSFQPRGRRKALSSGLLAKSATPDQPAKEGIEMTAKDIYDKAGPLLVDDGLPPHLRGRVKALIFDLTNDDLPMALLDLAHLYRALRTGSTRRAGNRTHDPDEQDDLKTLIFNDLRTAIDDICMGPDHEGKCPRAQEGRPAACAGRWIMARGWNFKVADDAEACPLVSLGIAHRYLRAAVDPVE